MRRFNTKKEIEQFSVNLKQLSDNLDNITTNVDDINSQFDNYGEQISDIKDNVKSLENELKSFIQEVKVSPIIEKAKKQIELDRIELEKKYYKHNIIREKLYNIIINIKDNEIDENLLLTNEEQVYLNIPDFYLSYVLFSVNSWLKNNKKSANKFIKQALSLNKEKTSLLLTIINYNVKREDAALNWLNYYLNIINPINTNDNIVKLLDYFKDSDKMLNTITKKIKQLLNKNKTEDVNNDIFTQFDSIFKIEDKEEKYPFTYAYCDNYFDLLEEIKHTKIFEVIYNKIDSWMDNSNNDYDFLYNIIYSYDGKEYELKSDILKNEYIIKNNGISKNIVKNKDKHILLILLFSLNNRKISTKAKEILLRYLKPYFLEYINYFNYTPKEKDLKIQIGDWIGHTKNGSNENELINDLTSYLNKPMNEELSKINYINYKTIYSIVFALIGIIVTFINSTIGIFMILIGIFMTCFMIYNTKSFKKALMIQKKEEIEQFKYELYNSLAEITDIIFIIKQNNNYKEILLNYFNKINEGEKK